jgi:hypothetical protein
MNDLHKSHATEPPAIRVFKKDGKLFTLDNRRLVAFQQAGVTDIPVVRVSMEDPAIAKEIKRNLILLTGKEKV